MACVFERSNPGTWVIRYLDAHGPRRQRSSRTTDKRVAKHYTRLELDDLADAIRAVAQPAAPAGCHQNRHHSEDETPQSDAV